VCCSVLQCVAVCCNICSNMLRGWVCWRLWRSKVCVAFIGGDSCTLQCVAALQCVAMFLGILHYVAKLSLLDFVAVETGCFCRR